MAAGLQVLQIRQPAGARQEERPQFVDFGFRLADRILQNVALGPLGFQRLLLQGDLVAESLGRVGEALHFMLDELAALLDGLLLPVEFSGAGDQSQFLGFLVFQHVLGVPGIHLQAGQLLARLVDRVLPGVAGFARGLARMFRGREFRQDDLLLFLCLRKAGGAFGQFCAELPLFHADFETLNRAHLVAQPAVAPRFCRLPAQGIELPDHFADDVLRAHQVLLRLFELHFRGIAAALEQGDPGRFFYEAAALRRF